ncbi:ubiquitin--protein ligase molybdopterin-converting factor [Metschnikowia bicuspidata]|uniref:Ubiquitin--protein ligase molybdopterin-converting factor n=2 Tax=Metschnikowia bicuspidata TaxID=27322 RepID=A0A4P9Z8B6_9ASCO|nr:ubiquitin--protein ligase molybdopterin-converting factor [Metschnikowia bicuspidata]
MSSPAKWAAFGAAAALVVVAALENYKQSSVRPAEEPAAPCKPHSEELIREQLARNYAFLTEDGMQKVRAQRIVVVGCGGVGSWVVAMLVRSGVETLRIVDFDQVSLSSLNRHAVATLADVGSPKVECLRAHMHCVAPWADIQPRNQLWTRAHGHELIFGSNFRPTLVVDCIDNIDTKVDLLEFCCEHKVPVVSSGGAACKSDPTRINIADILKTEEDALARSVRIRLTKRGIVDNVPVVFSAEKPDPRKAKLLPLDDAEIEKGDVEQLAVMRNFRVRILPVLGTMPGMFGLALSTHIITTVAGYPTEYVEGKNRIKSYDGIFQSLAGQQARIGHPDQRTPVAMRDVPYIVEEVFRGKSVVSNYSTRLTLSRWRPDAELSFQNIVVMTKDEQRVHEEQVLKPRVAPETVYGDDVVRRAEMRFAQERYYATFH